MIAAARDLFDETGYDDTTVRAIAQRAGVSVGSVFTTFSSKAELLSEVMLDRLDDLHVWLEKGLPNLQGGIQRRLSLLARMFYDFETRRPNLYLAYLRTAFAPGLPPSVHRFGKMARVTEISRNVLIDAVERGELRRDLDIDLMITALSAYYLWTYRDLAMTGADAETLSASYDGLVGQLLSGVTIN